MKGAVISSEATPDKNKLSTDTLTYSDIQNKADYSASSVGVNVNTNPNAKLNEQGVTPNIGVPAKGNASSTTKSAISAGTIEIRSNPNQDISGLSRSTDQALNALGKIFDKKSVQEKQELAKVFGEEAFKKIGDLGLKEGSPEKIALDAFAGGIMAQLGGGSFASGAAGSGFNQIVINELAKIKDPAVMQWASVIAGAAAAKAVGGDAQTGGSTASSETKNNYLNHKQQRQKEEELENAKTDEEKAAIKAKWDAISDAQIGNPSIEVPGTTVYDKDNTEVYVLPGVEVKVNYNGLFDQLKQWYQNTTVYSIYKQGVAPVSQGLGASIIQNGSWNLVQPDMSNGNNPRMYYVGKTLGDFAFVVGGTLVTITNGGATIATSPTGVGAIGFGGATVAAGTATANGVYNFSNDFSRIFASNGASSESGNSNYASSYKQRLNQTPTNSADGGWVGNRGESTYISNDSEVKAILNENGLVGIKYNNAIPDFSPVSKGEVKISGMTANRRNNFALADEALAQQRGVSVEEIVAWRKENNLTWHECNDTKTMQAIPSKINAVFGHFGGVGEINAAAK